MVLPPCLINFFDYLDFGGRGATRVSTMVSLGRELVSSQGLSIQSTLVSGTVWPQFAMQVLTGVANTSMGKWWSYGVGDGSSKCPGMTTYRLPIVTIVLSVTVFAVLWMFQTDKQTDQGTDGQMDGRTELV